LGLPIYLWNELRAIHRQFGFLPIRSQLIAVFFIGLIIIFAVAFWTVWKEKPSARGWGIAASLAYILIYFVPINFKAQYIWWYGVGNLAIGVLGLAVFSGRYKLESVAADSTSYNDPTRKAE
jgi:uncharacterized membrane protein (DUF106 family)